MVSVGPETPPKKTEQANTHGEILDSSDDSELPVYLDSHHKPSRHAVGGIQVKADDELNRTETPRTVTQVRHSSGLSRRCEG